MFERRILDSEVCRIEFYLKRNQKVFILKMLGFSNVHVWSLSGVISDQEIGLSLIQYPRGLILRSVRRVLMSKTLKEWCKSDVCFLSVRRVERLLKQDLKTIQIYFRVGFHNCLVFKKCWFYAFCYFLRLPRFLNGLESSKRSRGRVSTKFRPNPASWFGVMKA